MHLQLFLAFLISGLHADGRPEAGAPGQLDVCRIFGAVYEEKNPRYADYRVHVEESEDFSDLVVFRQDNRLFADRAGLWFFTDKKEFADFSVYFDKQRGTADFSISFTDTESFAGCRP
jgi:hypothetical protein